MIDQDFYKVQYETAEHRALYIVARKGYGSFKEMADALNVTQQYINNLCKMGVPVSYAGFLGRKFGFHPGILNFIALLDIMQNATKISYEKLVRASEFFAEDDQTYILSGTYLKDPAKYLRQHDKNLIREK